MGRAWWILPLCLLLHGQGQRQEAVVIEGAPETYITQAPQVLLSGPELARQHLLAGLALATQADFPATVPWTPMYQIGAGGLFPLENILTHQPLLFLKMCLEKQDREIQSYSHIFRKQERIQGKLQEPEKIKVYVRERPFSIRFEWLEGARLAKKALYVEGENRHGDKEYMLVRPNLPLLSGLVVSREVAGSEAKQSGRYTIDQAGLKKATERTLASMHRAQERGKLHIRYEGLVAVPELSNRKFYKFVRAPYDPVEEEGVHELTLYIDQEHWLQVGSVLKDSQGDLIARYFFDDVRINPELPPDIFTRKGL